MSFEAAEMAVKTTCPENKLLYDDTGMPSAFVYIPKFRLCDVLSVADSSVHPAFRVNGQEIEGFYVGKFQTRHYNDRAYSLPCEDPSVSKGLNTFVECNRNKGSNYHEITNAEWAAVALWCHKHGCEPKGNNNYGKDSSETLYLAIPSMERDGSNRIQRVATGTGPMSWSHDRSMAGIWDLNGNVNEWCTGLRLVKGELQILQDNDAADPSADLSASSGAWKAINANATAWNDMYLTPDGNGTTTGSVKLDYINSKWTWSTSITSSDDSGRSCAFKNILTDATISDTAKKLLMALALLPDTALTGDKIDANYGEDTFMANNAANERRLYRGGSWVSGAGSGTVSGVFCTYLYYAQTIAFSTVGGRSAFIEPQLEE